MGLKVVQGGQENSSDVFIIQVINIKGEKGYVGEVNKKMVMLSVLTPEVMRFNKFYKAQEFGKQFDKNVKVNILGKKRIEEILAKDAAEMTIPMKDVDIDIFHITIKDSNTNEILGYLTHNQGTNQYGMTKGTEGAAFWDDEIKAGAFLTEAQKMLSAKHPHLVLSVKKFSENQTPQILTNLK